MDLSKNESRMLKATREGSNRTYTVSYGLMMLGNNRAPYFTVTLEIKSKNHHWESGGQQHDEVAKIFPELAPFLKWHLCDREGPMHYEANAIYWWNQVVASDSPKALECFKSTIVFEAVDGDNFALEDLKCGARNGETVEAFLAERLPRLKEAFAADMAKVFAIKL